MSQRLDAFLAHAGHGTRSEVRRLIRQGRVRVDGVVNRSHSFQLADDASVRLDGEVVEPPPSDVVGVLYKPAGVACSHDERERPIVVDCLPEAWQLAGAEWAGRLDRMTTGLLVCATDGQLLHRLIHPKRKVVKRYQITWTGSLATDAVAQCETGLQLPDEERPCRPARLSPIEQTDAGGHGSIELVEGRYHQVRRMIAALGGEVTALHRDRIGAYDLPAHLIPGETQAISDADVAALLTPSDDPLFHA